MGTAYEGFRASGEMALLRRAGERGLQRWADKCLERPGLTHTAPEVPSLERLRWRQDAELSSAPSNNM